MLHRPGNGLDWPYKPFMCLTSWCYMEETHKTPTALCISPVAPQPSFMMGKINVKEKSQQNMNSWMHSPAPKPPSHTPKCSFTKQHLECCPLGPLYSLWRGCGKSQFKQFRCEPEYFELHRGLFPILVIFSFSCFKGNLKKKKKDILPYFSLLFLLL